MKTRRRYRRKSISKRRRRRSTKKKRRYRRKGTKKKKRRRRRGGEGNGKPKKTLKRTKPRMIYGDFVDPKKIKMEEERLMRGWTSGYAAIQEKHAPKLAKKTRRGLRQSAVENVVEKEIKPYRFK